MAGLSEFQYTFARPAGAYQLTRNWLRSATALVASGAIFLCFLFTRQQLGHGKDTETSFRHAIEVTESNLMAHRGLGAENVHYDVGLSLYRNGRPGEAFDYSREASRLGPGPADPRVNLDLVLSKKTGALQDSGPSTVP